MAYSRAEISKPGVLEVNIVFHFIKILKILMAKANLGVLEFLKSIV